MQTPSEAGNCGSIDVQESGVDVVNPATILNFTGAGVTVTNAGNGEATITIAGGGGGPSVDVENQGAPIANNPHTTLNFVGAGVVAADAGGGVATVTIAGGGGSAAVIFDGGGADENLRSTRATEQSPIDNTKSGIVNLASATGTFRVSVGATGTVSTISGGDDNDATGDYSTVIGGQANQATDLCSIVGGQDCISSARCSVALGEAVQATAEGAFAVGGGAIASGSGSFAQGSGTAAGQGSVCLSDALLATGTDSMATGLGGQALRDTQKTHAAGSFNASNADDAQTSLLVLRGQTPGAAPGESIELAYGLNDTTVLSLEDDKCYTFDVSVIVGGVVSAAEVSRSFKLSFNARRIAGASTITAQTATETFGDASTASWTFIASIGAAPDRIVLTFTTGATTSLAFCVAKVSFTETGMIVLP